MTDPKAGKANIKKKRPIPNYCFDEISRADFQDKKAVFQRNQAVKIEVSDYNSKAGKLKL